MRSDLKDIFELLQDGQYHTAAEIGEKLNISPKTVRSRLKELGDIIKEYGVNIDSKARYGFILTEDEPNGIEKIMEADSLQNNFPDNTEERTNYLLAYLLNRQEYTKIEDLCEFLCVSRSTLQMSIKQAEEILGQYQIQIDRKPNYGICVKGNEFDIRRCVGECFIKRNMLGSSMQIYSADEINLLVEKVQELISRYKVSLSENEFDNLITQIYVALKRIKRGYEIRFSDTHDKTKYHTEYELAEELAKWLEEWQQVVYTQDELRYIVIYLAGIRMLGNTENNAGNFVIREELDRLVLQILERIYDEFKIEMRSNFNLRMSLNQHMVPFDIRMRYHIKIANPILEEIQQNYVFAYTLAVRGCSVLEQHYGTVISEDEIGYFAMLFAFALEQRQVEIEKSRILIVCSAGRGSSQLLRYKYEQEFKEYLKKVYVCGLHELTTFDFEKVDYVFTTVPIRQPVPVPITEVGQFLGNADIVKIKQVLERGHVDFLDDYYKENQFLTDIEGNTKEEVIQNICNEIVKQRELPDGFYEAVIRRENLAQTDFGNYIAMPHPYKIITEETFIYVAVLRHEIMWNKFPVQLVFLSAISDKEDKNLPKFYEVTTSLFVQEDMVKTIIQEKNFGIMMQMLRQLYYKK